MNKHFTHPILLLVVVVIIGTSVSSKATEKQEALLDENNTRLVMDGGVTNNTFEQEHIPTPKQVRALYLTAWAGGTNSIKNHVAGIIDKSPTLNAVVIDIKDATGELAYRSNVPLAVEIKASSNRIPDIQSLIDFFHSKGIYVIGRISVFQDPLLATKRPQWALRTTDGAVWLDKSGLAWLDPKQKSVWDYIVSIGVEAYQNGFDEINLDYVRYPSDGNLALLGESRPTAPIRTKNLEEFFLYMDTQFRQILGIPLSADVFGLVTSVPLGDDLGIGQEFITIARHVDAIAPMIYPSHYAPGFAQQSVPARAPFAIIDKATADAVLKLSNAQLPVTVYRPWIQDFDLGSTYGITEVHDQIRALEKNGIYSYMVWDPANRYTPEAYYTQH